MDNTPTITYGDSDRILEFLRNFEQKFELVNAEQKEIIIALMGSTLRKDGGMIKEQEAIKSSINNLEDRFDKFENTINARFETYDVERKKSQWTRTVLAMIISFVLTALGAIATILGIIHSVKSK